MDIMNIIDKYVEISVKRQRVENSISHIDQSIWHTKIKGEGAFREHDFKLEEEYNKANDYYKQMRENLDKELAQVMQELENIHQIYLQKIDSMSKDEIEDASVQCSLKIDEKNKIMEELSEKREFAIQKGNEAFKNHNYTDEQKYNEIAVESYKEVENIKTSLIYYNSFVYNLNYNKEIKEQKIESSGFSK